MNVLLKQKTAYEVKYSLVGTEICIRNRVNREGGQQGREANREGRPIGKGGQ